MDLTVDYWFGISDQEKTPWDGCGLKKLTAKTEPREDGRFIEKLTQKRFNSVFI